MIGCVNGVLVGNHANHSIIKITAQDTPHSLPSVNRPEGFLRHQVDLLKPSGRSTLPLDKQEQLFYNNPVPTPLNRGSIKLPSVTSETRVSDVRKSGHFNNGHYRMEPVTFYNQTTHPPDYLAGRRFVPLGSSISNAPALTTPTRRDSFVQIYFKKSTRFNLSNLSSVIASPAGAWQSPGSILPAISRILIPQTKRHHLYKTMTWSSSNRNELVPRISLKALEFKLSHLALIFPSPCPSTPIRVFRVPFPIIPLVHTSPQTTPQKCAVLPKNRALSKGKRQLIRGSNQSLNFSSPFLAPLKTPRFLSKNYRFPLKNDCLDIIEPRIEPRTPRGRFLSPGATSRQANAGSNSAYFPLDSCAFPTSVSPVSAMSETRVSAPLSLLLFTIIHSPLTIIRLSTFNYSPFTALCSLLSVLYSLLSISPPPIPQSLL